MSTAAETGAMFSLRNEAGATVFSAPVGANLGRWSNTYSNVYALDFSEFAIAGRYTISVAGPVAASSPTFRVDAGGAVYSGALTNALSFYQTQRDGPNFIASGLRTAPAHLNDQNAMTYETPNVNSSGRFSGDLTPLGVRIDASGGWWDAGASIKEVHTLGHPAAMLVAALRAL